MYLFMYLFMSLFMSLFMYLFLYLLLLLLLLSVFQRSPSHRIVVREGREGRRVKAYGKRWSVHSLSVAELELPTFTQA
jgi:hypothetical protein